MPTKPQQARRYQQVQRLLRALREEAELTQRALAQRLRRTQSWVFKSETGIRRVDLAEFCDWCAGCGIEPVTALRRFLAE